MAENTKIEWVTHTFNPWYGCPKKRQRRRSRPAKWVKPVKWNATAARLGVRYRIICASLADVFDNAVEPAWRADLLWAPAEAIRGGGGKPQAS